MERIIVLNADYSFLNIIDWKRAIKLIMTEKAEIVESMNKFITNTEKTIKIQIPKILRLINMVNLFRPRIPYSKKNIFLRDEFTCKYCGKKGITMTVDHIIPKSYGGKSSFLNCVASCLDCNLKKRNRTPEEAGMEIIGKKPYLPTIAEFIQKKAKLFNLTYCGVEK